MMATNCDLRALTYNKNYKRGVLMCKEDYDVCIRRLERLGIRVIETSYEYGKVQNRLHMHLLILMDENVSKFKLGVKGFSHKLVDCYDTQGWLDYIRKSAVLPLSNSYDVEDDVENDVLSDVDSEHTEPPAQKLFV